MTNEKEADPKPVFENNSGAHIMTLGLISLLQLLPHSVSQPWLKDYVTVN